MKRLTTPGSVFARSSCKRLYVKLHGKNYATGLLDTPKNRRIAADLLERMYLQSIGARVEPVYLGKTKPEHTVAEIHKKFTDEHGLNKSKSTLSGYQNVFNYLLPNADSALTESVIEKTALSIVRDAKISARSQGAYLTILKTFVNWCVSKRYLKSNPIPHSFVPKAPDKVIEVYTDEEVKLIVSYYDKVDKNMANICRFLVLTGFRIHEAVGLKWTDIQQNRINVVSKDGKRAEHIPLNDSVRKVLNEQRIMQKGDRVFGLEDKKLLNINAHFSKALEEIGIDRRGRSFHVFRKTFISNLANNGVDVRIASQLARCNIDVMMKHYTKLNTDNTLKASEKAVIPSIFNDENP